MPFMCWKSPEGVEEYKKVGMEYPTHVLDEDFEKFMAKIQWDPNKRETIRDIIRVKTHVDKEFLVYSSTIRGQDQMLKNYDERSRSRLGTYMVLEPYTTRSIKTDHITETSQFNDKVTIGNMRIAYSIPFTKEKLEELHQKCVDNAVRINDITKYYVEPDGGTMISVPKYEDFRDGDFDDLCQFGCIPTKEERTTSKQRQVIAAK